MIFNVKGRWTDSRGRSHNFVMQSDSADRDLIRQMVESRYPTQTVFINSVRQS